MIATTVLNNWGIYSLICLLAAITVGFTPGFVPGIFESCSSSTRDIVKLYPGCWICCRWENPVFGNANGKWLLIFGRLYGRAYDIANPCVRLWHDCFVAKRMDGSRWFLVHGLPSTTPTLCYKGVFMPPRKRSYQTANFRTGEICVNTCWTPLLYIAMTTAYAANHGHGRLHTSKWQACIDWYDVTAGIPSLANQRHGGIR